MGTTCSKPRRVLSVAMLVKDAAASFSRRCCSRDNVRAILVVIMACGVLVVLLLVVFVLVDSFDIGVVVVVVSFAIVSIGTAVAAVGFL